MKHESTFENITNTAAKTAGKLSKKVHVKKLDFSIKSIQGGGPVSCIPAGGGDGGRR